MYATTMPRIGVFTSWNILRPFTASGTSVAASLASAAAPQPSGEARRGAAAAVAARRHLGRVAMAMTVVGALAITWRWGAAQLVRPYNLTATALPLLALLVLTWVLLAGGRRWTPLWVFVASWCAQTHIGLLPLVVLLAALLVVLRARAWWAGARRWLRDRALGEAPDKGDGRLLVAARLGAARLIDNVGVSIGIEPEDIGNPDAY